MKYILIKADTNDADYTTSKHSITDQQIEEIRPVVTAIKAFRPYKTLYKGREEYHEYNYPRYDGRDRGKSPEELYGHLPGFQLFDEMAPYGENGIHTIVGVEIIEVLEKLL